MKNPGETVWREKFCSDSAEGEIAWNLSGK